ALVVGRVSGSGRNTGRPSLTLNIALHSPASLPGSPGHRVARLLGCSPAIERRQLGASFPPPRGAGATTSLRACSTRRDKRPTHGSPRSRSSPARNGAL